MGYKHDQNYFAETHRPHASPNQETQPGQPPPLPPRLNTSSSTLLLQPPPSYAESAPRYHARPLNQSWASQDPRSSSTESLVPAGSGDGKRQLLLIYIHGFLGDEDSFRSFPAHVHNFVTQTLAETHVVHTKIYPRYKSRKAIEYARNDFSEWLRPHESAKTDIILLGHSMGGLLSAEVVLLSSSHPTGRQDSHHCIVGTINFDCPFLGMHPGVVISGIGSIFRPAPASTTLQPQDSLGRSQGLKPESCSNDPLSPSISISQSAEVSQAQSSNNLSSSDINSVVTPALSLDSGSLTRKTSASIASSSQDPNYNPPFPNDIRIPVRSGWDNALHFVTKHSNDLSKAARSYVTSHLEFGGCLADYKGLKSRYARLRALEHINLHQASHQAQVRFVNYYTASTGRPKKAKLAPQKPIESQNTSRIASETNLNPVLEQLAPTPYEHGSPLASPRVSVDESLDGEKILEACQSLSECNAVADEQTLAIKESTTLVDENAAPSELEDPGPQIIKNETPLTFEPVIFPAENLLPPLPKLPEEPPPFDPAAYPDKDVRNLAQKEHSRQTKNYIRATKDQDRAVKERQKLIEKKEKLAKKEVEKKSRLEEKGKVQSVKEAKQKAVSSPSGLNLDCKSVPDGSSDDAAIVECREEKPKRDKKFCLLPPKINQQADPCWVRVSMNGVDEVGAHCGLFIVGDHYGWLVDDVGTRIKEWIDKK